MSTHVPHAVAGAAVTLALLGVVAIAAPAGAACGVTAQAVAAAPVVFVGTLANASDDGSVGRFAVDQVWHSSGLPMASPVSVQALPGTFILPPPGQAQSRYLVLADVQDGALVLPGLNCEIFAFPWDDSYAAFGPAAPETPAPGASDEPSGEGTGSGPPAELVALIAAAAVLVIAAGFAFRSRPSS